MYVSKLNNVVVGNYLKLFFNIFNCLKEKNVNFPKTKLFLSSFSVLRTLTGHLVLMNEKKNKEKRKYVLEKKN